MTGTGSDTERAESAGPVSPMNLLDLVSSGRRPPTTLLINDVTLREAEQGSGVVFPLATKLAIANALVSLGVRQFQVGYPGRFARDREAAHAVVREVPNATVEVVALAFVEDWKSEIDACASTGAQIIHITNRSSERLRRISGASREAALERTAAAIHHAKSMAHTVTFAPSDATRTEVDFLAELWTVAANAGADRVYVADSVGVATPDVMAFLVKAAREATGLPVGVHCHNDFGLAVANTVAGVMAGATVADVAVNGLGDRAGNAPLEEVAAALTLLYDIHTGIDLAALTRTSLLLAAASGRPLTPNKPVTGPGVFTHVLPTHIEAIGKDTRSLQPYEPELVGNEQRLEPRQ
jgi:isopropylmalate/homocitrate/citramalate synthase